MFIGSNNALVLRMKQLVYRTKKYMKFLYTPQHGSNTEVYTTVNADIFAWLIFRVLQLKNIFAGCYIRVEQMLTCHFCTAQLTSFNEWYIYKYVCNWAAQKQADLRQTWVYYPFASTHMVNTQLLRHFTCPKCAYKISQIFSLVFEFALAEKPWNPWKLMYREYFRVYSISLSNFCAQHYCFMHISTYLGDILTYFSLEQRF